MKTFNTKEKAIECIKYNLENGTINNDQARVLLLKVKEKFGNL